jgi:hypothetical protein
MKEHASLAKKHVCPDVFLPKGAEPTCKLQNPSLIEFRMAPKNGRQAFGCFLEPWRIEFIVGVQGILNHQ